MTSTEVGPQPSSSRAVHTLSAPRKGCQSFSLNVDRPLIRDDLDDPLNELLDRTWTVYGVSVLFNFHPDQVHLKKYGKKLREEVANSLAQENVAYNAEFFVVENAGSDSLDPPIKIEVYSKTNGTTESINKCIYKGMLLSCKESTQKLVTPNAVRLPLLLCRGTAGVTRIVHEVLRRIFDCLIVALPIGEDDLMWLLPIVIFPANQDEYPKRTDEILMDYRIPDMPVTDSIVIRFRIVDLLKILKAIINMDEDETDAVVTFTSDHIEKFREILYTEMLVRAKLQLGLCTLHKVTLSGHVLMGNKMKSVKPDTMNRILLYMNERAFETLHTINVNI